MLKTRKQVMGDSDGAKVQTVELTRRKPLRLWPGVVIVMFMWLSRYVVPVFVPDALYIGFMGGVFGGGLAIVVWWVFFSRAPWADRLGALALTIIAVFATSFIIDKSIATAMMGNMFFVYAIPVLSLALVVGAVVGRRLAIGPRRAVMATTILFACAGFTLVRTDGMTGAASHDFSWRWTATAEERLLAQEDNDPSDASGSRLPADVAATVNRVDWPGFRGPNRDGIVFGVRIESNWSASPPVELWRQPVGPGVSSFAVCGDLFYTQEQRGDDEIVACYNLATGEPVWMHSDATRYWEAHAGAGPRATPALSSDGQGVYTFGATGIVNALNANDGAVVWSRNAMSDTRVKLPPSSVWYGFSSSPLVVDDLVIVAARGKLVAYDLTTGDPRWFGPDSGYGYSSPHLFTIGGVAQILLQYGPGVISVVPADGTLLWQHRWPGAFLLQPALIADGDVLIGAGDTGGIGMRRIAVTHGADGWTVEERWTSNGLKPYFNDFVIHNGHAFGFDGSILACIDIEDGKRKWKGGRYGNGQLVLLADQGLLLVLSERGELALVSATPEKFTELARFPAIEGKTWNHPALVGDVLLVRNTQEMAAFRLALAGR